MGYCMEELKHAMDWNGNLQTGMRIGPQNPGSVLIPNMTYIHFKQFVEVSLNLLFIPGLLENTPTFDQRHKEMNDL